VRFKDQPGTCYEYCNELANQNVNINAFFVTTDGHEVFETNNPSKAQEVAQNLGVYHEPAYA
ncbi:MAG: hypothetical protein KDK65_08080, partial [Chlamydiia bacterium]|nr:hypothetical protein [Chlamydiia bacterium]